MTGRSRARDRSRPSGGAPAFTPASRGAELAAWLRADLGITLNVGNVSAQADQSGNGRNFTQGTAANQPGWSASDADYGNQPVLTFDGGDWLDAIAAWNLVQPGTVYVVGEIGTSADYKTFIDAAAGARWIVRATAGELLSLYGGAANIEPGASVVAPSIVCAVFNGASSAGYVSNVTASVTGNPGSGGMGTPRIGATPTGTYPLPTDAKLAEIVFTTVADDAAQRAQMFAYFRDRYGIAVTGL